MGTRRPCRPEDREIRQRFCMLPSATEEQRGQRKIEGVLGAKVSRWQEEVRSEREEESRLWGRRWDEESMDVDDEEGLAAEEPVSEGEYDENDTPETKALTVRFL